jgi:hypothetical protein
LRAATDLVLQVFDDTQPYFYVDARRKLKHVTLLTVKILPNVQAIPEQLAARCWPYRHRGLRIKGAAQHVQR